VNSHVEMNGALEKLLPASQREMQAIDDRSQFLSMRHKYLADVIFISMSEVLNMLAYGKHIRLTASNSGNAYWSEDKKTFYLNCQPILVSRFCKMAQELVAETSEKLWELRGRLFAWRGGGSSPQIHFADFFVNFFFAMTEIDGARRSNAHRETMKVIPIKVTINEKRKCVCSHK
jgi:hypothetical protein